MTPSKLLPLLALMCITLLANLLPGLSTPLQASEVRQRSPLKVTFQPPGEDRPRETAGGASRGEQCPQDTNVNPYITPLIPAGNTRLLTATARPTFFVYVPQTSAQKAFFSLQDEQHNNYYQSFLTLDRQSGIASISLPADAPALEVGKPYRWYFVLMCDNILKPDSPLVEGHIQRIEPALALISRLEEATPLERAALYGEAGIWYDTLATLAQLRRSNPNQLTLATNWEELLKSVGLEAIASQPFVD